MLSSENKKCIDSLSLTKKRGAVSGRETPSESHEMTLLAWKKRSTLPNGTVPFYVTFSAISAS